MKTYTHLDNLLGGPCPLTELSCDSWVVGDDDVVEVHLGVHGPDLDGDGVDLADVRQRGGVLVELGVRYLLWRPHTLRHSRQRYMSACQTNQTTLQTTGDHAPSMRALWCCIQEL